MASAHNAAALYKKQLPGLKAETDASIADDAKLKKLADAARESGSERRAGYQLLCAAEVVLQALAIGSVEAKAFQSAGAGPGDHTRSMRSRKCRLGDLLPVARLEVRDGAALHARLEAVLQVQARHLHNKLQELGLCPPGLPVQWGRGPGSSWQQAWSSGAAGVGRGQLALLRSQA